MIEDTNPSFSIPFGFAGGLFDRDLGFVRFGWRDYDTDTARWTAKDPIGAAGGDRDWYGYCLDDPVIGSDPSGLFRFAKRPLDGAVVNKMSGTGAISTLTSVAFPKLSLPFKGKLHELDDKTDTQFVHEQGFYGYKPQDKVGKPGNVEVESVGFFKDGIRKNNSDEAKRTDFVFEDNYYDDNTIRKDLKRIEPEFPAGSYNLPTNPFKPKKNCQDFTTRLREEYGKVSREENLKKGKEWSGR